MYIKSMKFGTLKLEGRVQKTKNNKLILWSNIDHWATNTVLKRIYEMFMLN